MTAETTYATTKANLLRARADELPRAPDEASALERSVL
jgi:hypothetical protein